MRDFCVSNELGYTNNILDPVRYEKILQTIYHEGRNHIKPKYDRYSIQHY